MRTHDGHLLNQVLGIGTFCTHTLVHADQAIAYDPQLPAPQMSLIGCGVMTGVGAALYAAGVRPGTSAAVPTQVGSPGTLEQALFCRDLAGTCVFIGVPGPGPTLTLDLQRFFDLGGNFCVSWYGDCLPTRDFPLLADWYRQGQLKLDEVVSRTIALEEVDEAFAAMERGETLRSVIVF